MQSDSSILRLPDELLRDIISLVHSASSADHVFYLREDVPGPNCASLVQNQVLALTLVCRRLNRIATPTLYSALDICISSWIKDKRKMSTALLRRTLIENPSLRAFCATVEVYDMIAEEGNSPVTATKAAEVLTWLTAARTFRFMGSLSYTGGDHLAIIELALKHMAVLTDLYVYDSEFGIDLVLLCRAVKSASSTFLRTLEIDGAWHKGGDAFMNQLQTLSLSSKFSEVKLSSFLHTPAVLDAFLRCIATLERLTFKCTMYRDDHDNITPWSLGSLQPTLERHRHTLRHLDVRSIAPRLDKRDPLYGFNLSSFEALETLSLNVSSTGVDTTHVECLVAPRLKKFHWDFSSEDDDLPMTLSSIRQEEEEWLRALAMAFVRKKAPLSEILVTYEPQCQLGGFSDGIAIYPWEHFDAVASDVRPYGITVSYNTPVLNWVEFLQLLNTHRRTAMAYQRSQAIRDSFYDYTNAKIWPSGEDSRRD
ncbi:hypothetical protein GQ53DRAFT_837973 [Thozetella sp. PMI_491]|nr:hypothetical protein GQ53DRAFT_837973 [Thozetella sp. PMI_491]